MELVQLHSPDAQRESRDSSTPHRAEAEYEAEEPANAAFRQDVPLDGGYGWVCTLSVFLINANTWGVNSVSFTRLLRVYD